MGIGVAYASGARKEDCEAAAGGLLGPRTRASLTQLNELCLALLVEQSEVRGAQAGVLLRAIAEALAHHGCYGTPACGGLPVPSPRRGILGPAALAGAACSPGRRCQRRAVCRVFHGSGTAHVARLVFTYAWHLARAESSAARFFLAMPTDTAAAIARWTLPQINALADCHRGWLTPRWPARVAVWRELLAAAADGDPVALERARLRGIALLAAEARMRTPRARV